MNYADIKRVDVANGEGVRVSLFVSGCNHHCKGCFNKCAWDFNYGNKFTEIEENKIMEYLNHDYVSGLTLLGGEPLEKQNQGQLLELVKNLDVVVDGKFEEAKKNLKLKFRGSENQRIIDVPETLKVHKIVSLDM